ncbi:nucleoside phosphorylase domain-containing protein [Aspergillus avenaceus]|uniref:Nucleoside phosphorylase domain-containing protein n=1 Tax=Aspergillus avenaceus TaxID=36643 RepID=A0A5N6TZ30_ASPAV|nr:nucleoside phosphorylase domain-containing protein [Aspergillus avenaceus]
MMLTHDDYTVGWVCALSVESAAAIALLDVRHEPLPTKRSHNNNYTFGRILDHNVVIAVLPSGRYGTTSAATVVTEMKDAFTNIRFYLMVGIGGGVPTKYDVRLGDIVVSKPFGKHGGIIQYDYGKQTGSGRFELTGSLNKPPQVLLTALANLDSNHFLGTRPFHTYLTKIIDKYPKFCHPGKNQDVLFEPHYEHLSGEDCSACHRAKVKVRRDRDFSGPVIHYGLIASGNRVIKHAPTRDRLADEHDILCFEMEAAGLMDTIPCLVIRGICDYSDSHKNKAWQPYAAAAAAAYGKELLSHVPLLDVELKSPTSPGLTETLEKLRSTDVEDDRSMLLAIKGKRAHGTCEWLTEDCRYMTWLHSQGSKLLREPEVNSGHLERLIVPNYLTAAMAG